MAADLRPTCRRRCQGRLAGPTHSEVVMPVSRGKDSNGPYYQWGDSGKRYYYTSGDKQSRERAKQRAQRQARAARARGYRG
jgi:hypothetical protein